MTCEKAAQALVNAGFLDQDQVEAAVSALDQTKVEFTYPAWADALAKAGLLDDSETAKVADVMENAGWAEADENPEEFDQGLESAGLLD